MSLIIYFRCDFTTDPMVPHVDNSLIYNRYSYCLNNPLRYIDPSGFTDGSADGTTTDDDDSQTETPPPTTEDQLLAVSTPDQNGSYSITMTSQTYGSEYITFGANGNIDVAFFNDVNVTPIAMEEQATGGDISNAALGVAAGVCEMAIGGASEVFSSGTTTAISVPLIVDGGVRTTANSARLIAYFTGHNSFGNTFPSNAGAVFGKSIDMAFGKPFYSYGFGQALGGGANDVGSFIYIWRRNCWSSIGCLRKSNNDK